MTVQVLIVTSDGDLALLLSTIAQLNEYQVQTCASADAALASIVYQPIGLVLLDTPCPDMSLEAFVHQLRARNCSAPVVLLSTDHDARFYVDFLALDGFLCKPFDIADIVAGLQLAHPEQERAVGD